MIGLLSLLVLGGGITTYAHLTNQVKPKQIEATAANTKEPKQSTPQTKESTKQSKEVTSETSTSKTIETSEPKVETPKKEEQPAKPTYIPEVINFTEPLDSRAYIVSNLTTGQVLLEEDADTITSVASLTKMMTAYILLDKLGNLNDTVVMDAHLIDILTAEGASMAGFCANDTITVKDLLYGVILPSGADASVLTANYISGSEDKFAELMTSYAKDMGMKNTQFKNATGLDQEGHYSTPHDLSILLSKALERKDFYEVFTTFHYQGNPTALNPSGYAMDSTVSTYDLTLDKGAIIGGKTGFTYDAELCLASLAQIGDQKYIMVSTGADYQSTVGPLHTMDAQKAYNAIGRDSHYMN